MKPGLSVTIQLMSDDICGEAELYGLYYVNYSYFTIDHLIDRYRSVLECYNADQISNYYHLEY